MKLISKLNKQHIHRRTVVGLVLGALTMLSAVAYATWPPAGTADTRAYSIVTTAVVSSDVVHNTGVSDGTSWYRLRSDASGRIIVIDNSCATPGATTAVSVGDTSTNVPAVAVSGQTAVCIFNTDTTDTVYCQPNGSSVTTANGWPIETSNWRCFPATAVMTCITTTGNTANVRAYGCGP